MKTSLHKIGVPLCIIYLIAALLAVFSFVPGAIAENEWTGNFNIILGAKALDEDEWRPVDQQGEVGLEIDFKHVNWPVSAAVEILSAGSREDVVVDGNTVYLDSETTEFNIGVKKIWNDHPIFRPFLSGGLSYMRAKLRTEDHTGNEHESSDGEGGLWIAAGAYCTIYKSFNIGAEARYSTSEVDIIGKEKNAGGTHLGLLVGYHW